MLYDNMSMLFAIIDRITILIKNFRPIKEQTEEAIQKLSVLEADIKQNIIDAQKELEDKIIEIACT